MASAQSDNPMPLRFTIRDLLWLTLVVAMAAGWWIDHKPQRLEFSQSAKQLIMIDNKTGEKWLVTPAQIKVGDGEMPGR